ncbi:MAG: CTP synthase [Spirochaetes bacterium GWD1_27_9]|nr:MAG: CTP synthase [Spirochaetes bacterium GWB1_27_13]OHD24174.1 MAG: CTP synthase [Spirochaetes bacterium GWC1_27_15]OHD41622.1 MAG: CTP synthase [Spirochaetes bacterium GWD1_27_9]
MKVVKYIFVTGGVCSSLGKGIASSSIGALLESRGFKISMTKIDPYINVDAGTMSPYQHGEVFVTDDGAETDLDLGNYERFTNTLLTKNNSITTGQVYNEVIKRERKGDYLGRCVQVIPHITDEIKRRIKQSIDKDTDVLIIEIGGTVGDIESVPFLEAARQFIHDAGKDNVLYVHLTLIPKIKAAGEFKTKPTQHSVQKLREIGIQPDILLCRIDGEMNTSMKKKVSLFTNVEEEAVVDAVNIKHSIYEVPLLYEERKLTDVILKKLRLTQTKVDISIWEDLIHNIKNPQHEIRIAVVGKYIDLQDAYKSIYEALHHASIANNAKLHIKRILSDDMTEENIKANLEGVDGVLIPGGFGDRGIQGKILTAKYARENKIPYFGICLGMQIMVIEYARNILGFKGANSTEFETKTAYPVISLLEEQEGVDKKGGTMRLGANDSIVLKDTRMFDAYQKEKISERHRHRYEFNNLYKENFIDKGLVISATTDDGSLVESVEWNNHPFGVGVQFHPEFKSKPFSPHPLFKEFIKAAVKNQ